MENIPNKQTEEQELQTSSELTNDTPVAGEEVVTKVEVSQPAEEVANPETAPSDAPVTAEVADTVEEVEEPATEPEPEEEKSEPEPAETTAEPASEVAEQPVEAEPAEPVAEETDEIELPEIDEEETEKEISVPDTNEGIIERLKTLAENAEQSEKAELDLLKQVFYKRLKEEKMQAHAEFIKNGGAEEDFKVEANPLEEEFKKIMNVIKEQRNKLLVAAEKQKELNLEKKKVIIERIKQFLTSPEDANKGYETVRALQNEWKEIKPIPASAANEIWKSYQLVTEQFYDLLKTNNALRDYDYKKNLEAKTKLCEEAEALQDNPDIIRASRILQELHQEFREIGPVAKELREDLWNRFKTASSAINKRHAQYFEQLKEKEEENLKKKTEICERIESIETANLKNFSAWDDISKKIIEMQAEWKAIGHATKKMNNKIYERYRAACDNFFNKKADFFKTQRKSFSENVAKKVALCEQAEALKDSTEWNKTTDALIALQKAWKEVGPVAHKSSVALWERFNAACNAFFDQKKKTLGDQKKEEQGNLSAKNAIIEKLKELVETGGDAVAEKVKELQAEWNNTGHVPFKSKDKIYNAYKEVCDELYSKFNIRQRRQGGNVARNLEKPGDTNSLFRQYEAKKSELTTYETNFSFLSANSKKGNALIDSMQKKIDALKVEVDELLKKIKEEQQAQKKVEETPASEEQPKNPEEA